MSNTKNKPPKTKLTLSIIIPTTRRRGKYLKMLLSSLLNADIPVRECEIIVVSDGEDAEIRKVVTSFGGIEKCPITFLVNKVKVGVSKARNIGIKKSNGSLLIFFDDDTIVHPNYFKHVIDHFAENGEVGCVVGRSLILPPYFVFKDATNLWSLVGKGILYDGGLSGANMAFSRDVIEKLGGFDERLGVYACSEDVDVFMRVKLTGYKLVHDVKAMVIHFKAPFGGVEGNGLSSLDYMYHVSRNDTYIYLKNGIWPLCVLKALRKLAKRFNVGLRSRRITPRSLLKVLLLGIPKGLIDAFKMYLIYTKNR